MKDHYKHAQAKCHFVCVVPGVPGVAVRYICIYVFVGVEMKFKGAFYNVLLSVSHVSELKTIEQKEGGLLVGASVTLSELKCVLSDTMKNSPGQ